MTYPARFNTPGWLFYPEETVRARTSFVTHDGNSGEDEFDRLSSRGACIKPNVVRSDHVTPTDWYREVVEVLEDNPYSFEEKYFNAEGKTLVTNREENYLGPGLQNVAFWDYPTGFRASMDNAFAKLSVKLRNKLHEGRNSVQLGNALGEAKQTVGLLSGSAQTMWQIILSLKNRDPRGFRKALGMNNRQIRDEFGKDAAGKYLAVQYGFIPLASDAFNLYQKLTNDLKRPLDVTVNGRESIDFDYNPNDFHRETWKGELRGRVTARVIDSVSHQIDEWGLLNPLSIAWELTPFSFMIDWGIPVSNVLQSITATAGLDFVNGYISDSRDGTRYLSHAGAEDSSSSHFLHFDNRGSHVTRYFTFRRTRLGSFPPPMLYGKDNPFTDQRVANALAVFRQLF